MALEENSHSLTRTGRRGNSKVGEEVGMRRATLLSLSLNRWHKDKGEEDGGWRSRRVQTLRRTHNQEAKGTAVQSSRRHKARQWLQEVH